MSKHVCVRLTSVPDEVRVVADSVELKDGQLIIKRGHAIVGAFYVPHVQGWWIEDPEALE